MLVWDPNNPATEDFLLSLRDWHDVATPANLVGWPGFPSDQSSLNAYEAWQSSYSGGNSPPPPPPGA